MKQSKLTKAVALMLSLVMVTSVFVGNTLSRYVTSVSSTDNARVAIWGINGDEVTMELFKTQYDLDGKKIAAANQNDDGSYDKIIAPGTGSSSAFSIINFMDTAIAPEVAYQVKIELDDTAVDERIKTNSSIQWKLDNNTWGTWEQLVSSLLLLSGDQSGVKVYEPGTFANAFKDNIEHTISWQWALDGNNETDTQMGIDALTGDISAKITVRVTAQQVDDLTTNAYLIEGANQVVNLNYVQPITLKSSADFSTFESVIVNGNPLTRDIDYTAVSGSTVITLKTEYLSNLETGIYTIDIVSENSTATTNFRVIDDSENFVPMLAASDTWYQGTTLRSSLKTINIVDEATEDIINNADESWPAAVDMENDGQLDDDVMCYVDGDVLTIAGNGSDKIYANYDSKYAFSDSARTDYFNNVTIINGGELLDTSIVKNMARMFLTTPSLTTIDVSNWDTSNVEDMSYMFYGWNALTVLDVSNWNTSNVFDMNCMFAAANRNQKSLTLDVSNWDTSNVEYVDFMFWGAYGLGTLDVSNWDVRKVKNFDHFQAHAKLTLVGVDNWVVTSAATNLGAMFHTSRNTTIDVSNWDVSNVINFSQTFEGTALKTITGLENWDTSKGISFDEMFSTSGALTKLDLSSFDTRNANNGVKISENGGTSLVLNNMFYGCLSLKEIKIGEKFSFNGDGTNTVEANKGLLPTPASGYWYTEDGAAYTPAEIQALPNPAGTYYAVKPTLN